MPEDIADDRLTDASSRLAAVEAERDRLQGELDSIANRALDRWLSVKQYESAAVASMQQTVSWKVTRPLRVVRERQLQRARDARRGSGRKSAS